MHALDFDLGLLGFDQDELARLLNPGVKEGLCDPDEVPAPTDEATTPPGDLWQLGEHRLLCGDSGNVEDVDRLLDGAAIHLVNTDPPYNVRVEPRSNNAIARLAFLKRASFPFVLISRRIAEYTVVTMLPNLAPGGAAKLNKYLA